jgi:hypothetical protein
MPANNELADREKVYVEKIKREILPGINYLQLDKSCNSGDRGYAAEVIRKLHDAFVDVYGADPPDESLGYISIPAVIRGRLNGRMCLGLVSLDLESSGEHHDTQLFTKFGVIDPDDPENSEVTNAFLDLNFRPYDYWYTVDIANDIHVDFCNVPPEAAKLLGTVRPDIQPGIEPGFFEGM